MAGEVFTTVIGNLTADPELRYTQAGLPVAGFTVAVNERKFNRQTNDWEDAEPLFMRCSVWREQAEHAAQTFVKGSRVMVYGKLKQRTYKDKDENTRQVIEIDVEEIGASLRYATAQLTRAPGGGQSAPVAAPAGGDAWATPAGGDETPW